jgi:hypothetical protein
VSQPRSARSANTFPVEEFVQALSAQLDLAQDALALKARTGRPLTFALKDLNVELKVFWEMQSDGRLLLRQAGPNEANASSVSLSFTTITRAMVEENTLAVELDDDPRALSELGGEDVLDAHTKRKLELVGVRTVGQLRRMSSGVDPRQMGALLDTPFDRLRAALARSSEPVITSHEVTRRNDGRPLLKIRGANLMNGNRPRVRLAGEAVEVLEARPNELLVRPMAHHFEGELEIAVGEHTATGFFELPRPAAAEVQTQALEGPERGGAR